MWAPEEEYKRASFLDKFFCNLMFIVEIIFFSGTLAYHLLHPLENSAVEFLQKLAPILMTYVGLFMMSFSRWYRKEFSELIQYVNQKTRMILERKDSLQHRPQRNKIYLGMTLILFITTVADISSPIVYLFKTIANGELYFKNVLLVEFAPFSVQVYVVAAVQVCLFYYVYAFCLMFIVIVIEPFLRLAMCYKIIATDIRVLRKTPGFTEEGELRKLVALMEECTEVYRFVRKANKINSLFFVVYVFSMFSVIGLFVAVSFTMTSPLYIATFLLFPANLYGLAGILCALGQKVMDSVGRMSCYLGYRFI